MTTVGVETAHGYDYYKTGVSAKLLLREAENIVRDDGITQKLFVRTLCE